MNLSFFNCNSRIQIVIIEEEFEQKMMLGNLIEMEYGMFPGQKLKGNNAEESNNTTKKARAAGDAVLKNVGGQELGGTGEEVERVDGGGHEASPAQVRLDEENLAHFDATQNNKSRILNRFLRVGQNGNQIVLQIKAPYLCLLQKVQIVASPHLSGSADMAAGQGKSSPPLPEHFDEVKNVDSTAEENGAARRPALSISCVQSFDVWGQAMARTYQQSCQNVVAGPLGSIQAQQQAHAKWIVLYDDQLGSKQEMQARTFSGREFQQASDPPGASQPAQEPIKLVKECHGISDTFRVTLTAHPGGARLPQGKFSAIEVIKSVTLSVQPCFKMPSASALMPLLNLCNLFLLENRPAGELLEIEIMSAQSLMAARKFIQAIEKLRKIQSQLLTDRQLASKLSGRVDLRNLAIQLEILCADCMNQHSLQAEKMDSYRRIIELSQNFASVKPIVANNGFPRCQRQIRDYKIVEQLIEMNPQLIQIMKGCLFNNIESVRSACLKHIEFIFDNIGCSIGNAYIPRAIQALIFTYPKNNSCNFVKRAPQDEFSLFQDMQSQFSPICLDGFTKHYQSSVQIGLSAKNLDLIEELFQPPLGHAQSPHRLQASTLPPDDYAGNLFQQRQLSSYSQSSLLHQIDQVSIYRLYTDEIHISDAQQLHSNQLLYLKNNYNHILESILQLINSASSFLLKQIFEQVLQHQIFMGPYDTIRGMQASKQLSTDLRVYLIKMSDKIMNICQGDVKIQQKFLNDLMKTIIPTLIVTKEQILLENQQSQENDAFSMQVVESGDLVGSQYLDGVDGLGGRARTLKALDEQSLLKNPGLIVSDIVKLACENLWNTIRQKVLLRYSLASSQMKFLLNWVNTNLQSLSQIIESADEEGQAAKDEQAAPSRKQLTQGHMAFLHQNLELIGDICQLQISHIQQVKPRLTQSQRLQRRLAMKAAKRRSKKMNLGAMLQSTFAGRNSQEARDAHGEADGRVASGLPGHNNINFQSEGFPDLQENFNGQLMGGVEGQYHLNNTINGQMILSQNINNSMGENVNYINQFYHPGLINQGYDGAEVFNNEMALMQNNMMNNYIPDNVTDLDLQNQLVDSIQDEFEDINQNDIDSNTQSQRAASLNSKLKAEEQDLLMGSHRLSDIFNRQRKLEILDQGGEQAQGLVIDHNQRLIKVPTSYIVQGGIIQLIQPLIYWLGYAMRTRDMLGLFKKIWSLLKLITQKCAARSRIKIDLIKIIFPHLQKVKEVCKDSTPSLDMLNFLKFVLIDIRPKDVRRNKVLRDFLLDFLMVFCKQIPHNLHDEIFQICKDIIELTKHSLTRVHIEQIINSLVDKYTMRSKAYKNVLRYFLQTCISLSQKQIAKAMSQDSVQRFVLQQLKQQGLLQQAEEAAGAHEDAAQSHEEAQMRSQHRQGASQPREEQENVATVRQEGRPAAPGRNGRREGQGGLESSISITHSQIENNVNNNQNNVAMADLVSTSQDDLDNYVYEDQESGTHVLDDDIDDHDFTNLRRQNQINNEYLQNQHRRQNHFRERTQHMNNQNHRQRQERMYQRQRQDRERPRGSGLFFQESHDALQTNEVPQSAPQVPYSQVQDSNRPEIQRQSQQQIMQSAPHETARQLQAQAAQQQHYRPPEAQILDQADAMRGEGERPDQRQTGQEPQRYRRAGDEQRHPRSARQDRGGQRQGQADEARHPQEKRIAQVEAELLEKYKEKIEQLETPFDIICDICLFKNKTPASAFADSAAQKVENQRNNKNASFSEIEIQEEIFSEKLDIIQLLFKELGTANVELFKRFLCLVDRHETLKMLFAHNEQSHQKIIKFVLDLANFFRSHIRTFRINKYQVQYQSTMMGAYMNSTNPAQQHPMGVDERVQVMTGLQQANASHAPGGQGPYQSNLEGEMNNDQVLRRSVGPGLAGDNRPLELHAFRQSQRSIPLNLGMDGGENPQNMAGNQLNNGGASNTIDRQQQEGNEFTGEGEGHTGHSDFFLRRQSHPANNNHDSNSLMQQPVEHETQNLRDAVYRSNQSRNPRERLQMRNQAAGHLIPRQQIATMNLNHSHNSLMFQNHLRGLGMMNQMSQQQQRPHLRSQHQSIQHNNELQPLLVNNLVDTNMNNHLQQQMQIQDPNGGGLVEGVGGAVGQQLHQQQLLQQHFNQNLHALNQLGGAALVHQLNQQGLDLQGQVIIDTVETLCQSRLILVKLFSQIIYKLIDDAQEATSDGDQNQSPGQGSRRKARYVQNPHAQQQGLHLILYMLTFLLPQPTLVNQMVQMHRCRWQPPGQPAPAGRNFELKLIESQERIVEGEGLRAGNGLQQTHPAFANSEADEVLRTSDELQALIGFTLGQLEQAKVLNLRVDQAGREQSRRPENIYEANDRRAAGRRRPMNSSDVVTAAEFSAFNILKRPAIDGRPPGLIGGSDLLDGTESTDLHYLASLLNFCLSTWPFIEGITINSTGKQGSSRQAQMSQMQSSFLGSAHQSIPKSHQREMPSAWVTQKYLCSKILQRVALLFNWPATASIDFGEEQADNGLLAAQAKRLEELMHGYQQKFDAVLLPLVNKLIQSENTEDTAIGLNILASLCGLTREAMVPAAEEIENNQSLSNLNEVQRLLQSTQRMRRSIFMSNGSKISITIWQEVFDILESKDSKAGRGVDQKQQNEIILREAASILIQLAAPRDSVYHFLKIAYEHSRVQMGKIVSILDYLNIDRQLDQDAQRDLARPQDEESSAEYSDSVEVNSSDSSHSAEFLLGHPSSAQPTQAHPVINQANQQSQEVLEFSKHVLNYFYMDRYTDSQLKQVLSFFEDEISKQLGSTAVNECQGAHHQLGSHQHQQLQTTTTSTASYNYQALDPLAVHNHQASGNGPHTQDQQPMKDSFDRVEQLAGSLKRQPDFPCEDQSNIMQLQNLWIDRGKQSTGSANAASAMQSFYGPYGEHLDRERAAPYRLDYFKATHLKSSADLFAHGGKYVHYLSQDAPIFDGFEDQIIQGLNNKHGVRSHTRQRSRGVSINSAENDESDFLIFERHFDKNGRNNSASYDDFHEQQEDVDHQDHGQTNGNYLFDRAHRNDQSPTDDLGIIDLDNDEDDEDDLFDVDDDKLPILKNIISKKNRPNNGKSVAIGSRSQGGIMKIRAHGEQPFTNKKYRQGSGKVQAQKNQAKGKSQLQKPNSAQRTRAKGSMQKHKNYQLTQASSVMQHRDEDKPRVIYDEDNLICDEFLTGRQRPQSGRVSRQRPLSGIITRINPMHPRNQRVSKDYNNKYMFQGLEQSQQMLSRHSGQGKMLIKAKNFLGTQQYTQAPPVQQQRANNGNMPSVSIHQKQIQARPVSSSNIQQAKNMGPSHQKRGSPQVVQQHRRAAGATLHHAAQAEDGQAARAAAMGPAYSSASCTQISGPLNELRQQHRASDLLNHPQSKLRGPPSLSFGEDLKIQNSALMHSVLVPQSLFDIDNDDYDRQKIEQYDKIVDQFESKIASSIDQIFKKMQRQQIIKSLPYDPVYTQPPGPQKAPNEGNTHQEPARSQVNAQKEVQKPTQSTQAQQKATDLFEEEKQEQQNDTQLKNMADDREATPARRNSEEGNDLSSFIPSPQDVLSRVQSTGVQSNPSNASEVDLPTASVTEPGTEPTDASMKSTNIPDQNDPKDGDV